MVNVLLSELPASSKALMVIIFSPGDREISDALQLSVPDAVPCSPAEFSQVTETTSTLSLALPDMFTGDCVVEKTPEDTEILDSIEGMFQAQKDLFQSIGRMFQKQKEMFSTPGKAPETKKDLFDSIGHIFREQKELFDHFPDEER